jgi:hypothetical protein
MLLIGKQIADELILNIIEHLAPTVRPDSETDSGLDHYRNLRRISRSWCRIITPLCFKRMYFDLNVADAFNDGIGEIPEEALTFETAEGLKVVPRLRFISNSPHIAVLIRVANFYQFVDSQPLPETVNLAILHTISSMINLRVIQLSYMDANQLIRICRHFAMQPAARAIMVDHVDTTGIDLAQLTEGFVHIHDLALHHVLGANRLIRGMQNLTRLLLHSSEMVEGHIRDALPLPWGTLVVLYIYEDTQQLIINIARSIRSYLQHNRIQDLPLRELVWARHQCVNNEISLASLLTLFPKGVLKLCAFGLSDVLHVDPESFAMLVDYFPELEHLTLMREPHVEEWPGTWVCIFLSLFSADLNGP